jgi:enoyl-CoA hydratase
MNTLEISNPSPGIALITFKRPQTLNSMNNEFVQELTVVLDGLAQDRATTVVVLTGDGRGFSSGHDVSDFRTDADSEPLAIPDAYDHQATFSRLIVRIFSLPQPVIAAVNGPASGAGFAMALAADTRVCSEAARFSAPFVRLGLSGGDCGVGYLLPRIVGPTLAFEMMLSGRLIGSQEALRHGLVLDVVPDGDVVPAALEIADRIRANSPFAVRMTKQGLWAFADSPSLEAAIEMENRTQVMCYLMDDAAEAASAFVEKRIPRYQHR